MATNTVSDNDEMDVRVDLPDTRAYKNRDDEELDRALIKAIHKAENADKDSLAHLLRSELKSHYYSAQLDL